MTLHHRTITRLRTSHRDVARIPSLDRLESPSDRRNGRRLRWRWPSLEGWLSLRAW